MSDENINVENIREVHGVAGFQSFVDRAFRNGFSANVVIEEVCQRYEAEMIRNLDLVISMLDKSGLCQLKIRTIFKDIERDTHAKCSRIDTYFKNKNTLSEPEAD